MGIVFYKNRGFVISYLIIFLLIANSLSVFGDKIDKMECIIKHEDPEVVKEQGLLRQSVNLGNSMNSESCDLSCYDGNTLKPECYEDGDYLFSVSTPPELLRNQGQQDIEAHGVPIPPIPGDPYPSCTQISIDKEYIWQYEKQVMTNLAAQYSACAFSTTQIYSPTTIDNDNVVCELQDDQCKACKNPQKVSENECYNIQSDPSLYEAGGSCYRCNDYWYIYTCKENLNSKAANIGSITCVLPASATGGTSESGSYKCAGSVKPEESQEDDVSRITEVIIDVWNSDSTSNRCCGDDFQSDLGYYQEADSNQPEGSDKACLLPDSNFDAVVDTYVKEDDNDWEWKKASANKFKIFNVKTATQDRDIVSDYYTWHTCKQTGESLPIAGLTGSVLENMQTIDAVAEEEGTETGDWIVQGSLSTSEQDIKPNIVTSSSSDCFEKVTVNEITNEAPEENEEYEKQVEIEQDMSDLFFATFDTSNLPSKTASAFLCFDDGDRSIFLDCCAYDSSDMNTCRENLNAKDRVRRQGEPAALITDMNFYAGGMRYPSDHNVVSILDQTALNTKLREYKFVEGSDALFKALNQETMVNDWRDYDYLELFLAFAGNSNIGLFVKGKQSTKYISHVIKYSVNGEQPMKWHRIRIPLSDLGNIGLDDVQDMGFFLRKDFFNPNDNERVDYKGDPRYNVFFVDRVYLSNSDDNNNKYCTSDFKWEDNLDEDSLACMETPGYWWTTKSSENSGEVENHCCGDDINESFEGGSYAGCWKGRPILNNTRFGKVEVNVGVEYNI